MATLIVKICTLLKSISDIGAMYGNLRAENILIELTPNKTKIKNVKFLNFVHLIEIKDAERICVPEQVDHFPPDMSAHLM